MTFWNRNSKKLLKKSRQGLRKSRGRSFLEMEILLVLEDSIASVMLLFYDYWSQTFCFILKTNTSRVSELSPQFKRTDIGLGLHLRLRVQIVDFYRGLVLYLLRDDCIPLILLTHDPVLKIRMVLLEGIWGSTIVHGRLSLLGKNSWVRIFCQLWTVLLLPKWFTRHNVLSFVLPLIEGRCVKYRFSFSYCAFRLMFNYIRFLCDESLPFWLSLLSLFIHSRNRLRGSFKILIVFFALGLNWNYFTFSRIFCHFWWWNIHHIFWETL